MPASAVAKLPYRVKDILGQKFGRLTVISFSHSQKFKAGTSAVWRCLCQCGKTVLIRGAHLRSGNTSSCKCANREKITKHGHSVGGKDGKSASSLYKCWSSMKNRCENRRCHNYSNYGGRGISVCERWRNSFANFLADVGPKPSPELSLDRINNNGNYEPGNVRWATASQQRLNTRRRSLTDEEVAKAIKLRQQDKTYKAIGELFGVGDRAVSSAIKREADKNA